MIYRFKAPSISIQTKFKNFEKNFILESNSIEIFNFASNFAQLKQANRLILKG